MRLHSTRLKHYSRVGDRAHNLVYEHMLLGFKWRTDKTVELPYHVSHEAAEDNFNKAIDEGK